MTSRKVPAWSPDALGEGAEGEVDEVEAVGESGVAVAGGRGLPDAVGDAEIAVDGPGDGGGSMGVVVGAITVVQAKHTAASAATIVGRRAPLDITSAAGVRGWGPGMAAPASQRSRLHLRRRRHRRMRRHMRPYP